jgi:hypothetical protein
MLEDTMARRKKSGLIKVAKTLGRLLARAENRAQKARAAGAQAAKRAAKAARAARKRAGKAARRVRRRLR